MIHRRLSHYLYLSMATVGVALGLIGCVLIRESPLLEFNTSLIDQGDFSSFQAVSQLDLTQIKPGRSYTYWELISVIDTISHTVASGGQLQRAELSRTTQAALDVFAVWQNPTETHRDNGFGPGCPPALCWQYVATVQGEQLQKWTSAAEVKRFLDEIDTPQDAVLLAEAAVDSLNHVELIKPAVDGYTVVVMRDGAGDDIQCEAISLNIYRELIHIARSGAISVTAHKLIDRFCGVF